MKTFRFVMFLVVAVAILFVAIPTAAQTKQRHQHRQNGDIWVGCVADVPATTWESALFNALSVGNKENRSCWINRQRGWWIFHWIEKTPVVTFKKGGKEPAKSSALFSIHRSY